MDEIQAPEVTPEVPPEAEPLPPVLEDVPVEVPAEVPPVETVAEMVCPQPEERPIILSLWHASVDLLVTVYILHALVLWLRKK